MLGTIVLYGLTPEQTSTQNQSKVLPAVVVEDHGGDCVNLHVFGNEGNSFNVTSVSLGHHPDHKGPAEYNWIPKPE